MTLIIALLCLAILAILAQAYNCDVAGCWRVGKFPLENTPYTVCPIHHPDISSLNESRIYTEYERNRVIDKSKH